MLVTFFGIKCMWIGMSKLPTVSSSSAITVFINGIEWVAGPVAVSISSRAATGGRHAARAVATG